MKALIDANILLDVIQERQPFEAAATRVWKLVEEGKLQGCVSAISSNNIYYVARKQIGGGQGDRSDAACPTDISVCAYKRVRHRPGRRVKARQL